MLTRLTNRGVLRLWGRDAASFLNGLTTNKTLSSTDGGAVYTGLLTPQGRVLCDALVYKGTQAKDDGTSELLVECDADVAGPLLDHLRKYKIRVKLDMADVSASFNVHVVLGNDTDQQLLQANGAIVATDPRHPSLGTRVLVPSSTLVTTQIDNNEEDYRLRRYSLGIPEGTKEIAVGEAFPFECNMDYANGVSLSKGCYLGQELTSRTFYKGVTRKRMMPLSLAPYSAGPSLPLTNKVDRSFDGSSIAPRAKLYRTDTHKSVGYVVGSQFNVGLGLVRWEALQGWPEGQLPAIAVAQEAPEGPTTPKYIYWAVPSVPTWWPSTNRPQ